MHRIINFFSVAPVRTKQPMHLMGVLFREIEDLKTEGFGLITINYIDARTKEQTKEKMHNCMHLS